MNAEERKARVLELIEQVGIPNPPRVARQYPHELSGWYETKSYNSYRSCL